MTDRILDLIHILIFISRAPGLPQPHTLRPLPRKIIVASPSLSQASDFASCQADLVGPAIM